MFNTVKCVPDKYTYFVD